ncbi:LuxR family transcriptional regulator [Bordetella ansorpii]|uniref:LuxR family transcriptional regulator n=2 Tax=Bordetella ansorpii TaxID=288768 RepID=A0A157NP63_9BORD|nr:LuxR family transcriptional regulator [Bordetella ansorpii]
MLGMPRGCGDDEGMYRLSAPTELAGRLPAAPPKPLSQRERTCLHWAAVGKTSWETSLILGVSEHTVNFHLKNACRKLGVRTRRAAVVAALQRGLLGSLTDAPAPHS